MRILAHQFHEIASPKKANQRGLEEYITSQEKGDKQIYNSKKPAYAFINNPVYRVGLEGDPAPQGLSSRLPTFGATNFSLKPSESALHLLHPTIESGNVFITQKNWDSEWHPSRQNIENVMSSEQDVLLHKSKMNNYNESVATQISIQNEYDRKNRPVPLYDKNGISDSPNGINYLDPHKHEIERAQELNVNMRHSNVQKPLTFSSASTTLKPMFTSEEISKTNDRANKLWFTIIMTVLLIVLAAILMFMNR